MWPIVLAFGSLAIFMALARSARGAAAEQPGPRPSLPAPATPAPKPRKKPKPVKGCTPSDMEFVGNVVVSIRKKTATEALALKALPVAEKCVPDAVPFIKGFLIAVAKRDKRKAARVPELVKKPDRPDTAIPVVDGKPAWFFDTRGGIFMAIPNNRTTLVVFRNLQAQLGVREDGRIGDKSTLPVFIERMKRLGFTKFPTTVQALTANAVKYTEVLRMGLKPALVGGSAYASPFPM